MSEIETSVLATTTVVVKAVEVRVTKGPDEGLHVRVDRPFFTIGKGDNSDLRLSDETVSREHLRLSLGTKGLLIEDGGSRNGTWLGTMRLDRALIGSDVTLTMGSTTIEIRVDRESSEMSVSAESEFGPEVVGVSMAMRHVFATLAKAADTDVTVLLEGESGVGKEVLARALHSRSSRRDRPFVVVDCGSIPATLIESEFFGHEPGAFTGATDRRIGLFEQADGGTIFLDEIGELPIDLQPKLLRVLESHEVKPVGASTVRPVNVRVIAATNRTLANEIKKRNFREDLFYRLSVLRLRVPSLRERREDIIPIANIFLRQATNDPSGTLPPDLVSLLSSYSWPGNVRELRNAVSRYAHLGFRERRELFDREVRTLSRTNIVPDEGVDLSKLTFHEARRVVLDRFERNYLPQILEKAGGVVTKAAELAGIARPSLYRMLDRLDIALPEREKE